MATNKSIFGEDIGYINSPTQVDGGPMIRAAQYRSEADATMGAANAHALEFLGTQAVSAYKGKLLADASHDITESIRRLQGFGDKALDAEKALQTLGSEETADSTSSAILLDATSKVEGEGTMAYAVPGSISPQDNPTLNPNVQQFLKDISKYKLALSQNVLKPQDVQNRIAATVKQYTAMMPGFGTDFRRLAAEMTGVNDIENLALRKALIGKEAESENDKLAARANWEIMQWRGYSTPDQITQGDRNSYALKKQTEAAVADLETDAKRRGMLAEEANQAVTRAVAGWKMAGATELTTATQAFIDANQGVNLENKAVADQLRLQLTGTVEQMRQNSLRKLSEIATAQNLKNSDVAAHQKDLNDYYDTLQKGFETIAGVNMFNAAIKNIQGSAQSMEATFTVLHPFMALAGKYGAGTNLFTLWTNFGGDVDQMAARLGSKEAAVAVASFFKDAGKAEQLAKGLGTIYSGGSISDVSKVLGAETAKVVMLDIQQTFEKMASREEPMTDLEKASVSKALGAYFDAMNTSDPVALGKMTDLINKGVFSKVYDQLAPEQRHDAFLKFMDTVQKNAPSMINQILTRSEQTGGVLQVDPGTGRLRVSYDGASVPLTGSGPNQRQELEKYIAIYNGQLALTEKVGPDTLQNFQKGQAGWWMWNRVLLQMEERVNAAKKVADSAREEAARKGRDGAGMDPMTGDMIDRSADLAAEKRLQGVLKNMQQQPRPQDPRKASGGNNSERTLIPPDKPSSAHPNVPAPEHRPEPAPQAPKAPAQDLADNKQKPILLNEDGSFSTEQTITIEADGRYYNIPTIIDGKKVSDEEAQRLFMEHKNKPVGVYPSLDEALAAARARTEQIGVERQAEADRLRNEALPPFRWDSVPDLPAPVEGQPAKPADPTEIVRPVIREPEKPVVTQPERKILFGSPVRDAPAVDAPGAPGVPKNAGPQEPFRELGTPDRGIDPVTSKRPRVQITKGEPEKFEPVPGPSGTLTDPITLDVGTALKKVFDSSWFKGMDETQKKAIAKYFQKESNPTAKKMELTKTYDNLPKPIKQELDTTVASIKGSDQFKLLVSEILAAEGGKSTDTKDPGNWTGGKVGVGEFKGTKYGISIKGHPKEDIANLTVKRAVEIYYNDYWKVIRGDELPPGVDMMMFASAVNQAGGAQGAIKRLQGVLGVKQDGVFGEATMTALKKKDPEKVTMELAAQRFIDYTKAPSWKTHQKGWVMREIQDILNIGKRFGMKGNSRE